MRRLLIPCGLAILLAIPTSVSAQNAPDANPHTYNHGEIGVYGDLFRVAPSGGTAVNYVGLGGRAGFNVGRITVLEAEMNYDFEKNYTNITVNNGNGSGSSNTYTASVRPITGLFGPKFQLAVRAHFGRLLKRRAVSSISLPLVTHRRDRPTASAIRSRDSEEIQRTWQRFQGAALSSLRGRLDCALMRAMKCG